MKKRITQCNAAEAALKKSGKHHKDLVDEALVLQDKLRRTIPRILSAQEAERKQISCDLQDENGQTLATPVCSRWFWAVRISISTPEFD